MCVVAALGIVLAACQGSPPATNPSDSTGPSVGARTTNGPSASPTLPPSPIVGEWVATEQCQRIADMLAEAGFDEFIAEQIYEFVPGADSPEDVDLADPCPHAVPLQHSHFFTAAGRFGSRDYAGRQVDDGTFEVRGSTLVINAAAFTFEINADMLRMQPEPIDVSGCTTRECRFQGAWVLMVSMPGTEWVRGTIAP
jgi:hypothetical protein